MAKIDGLGPFAGVETLVVPWALVDADGLKLRYANHALREWVGTDDLPESLVDLFPVLGTPRMVKRTKTRRTLRWPAAAPTMPAGLGEVSYLLRPIDWKGTAMWVLHGEDLTTANEKQALIDSYAELIEAKNRQLEESYTRLHALDRLKDELLHMIVHDMRTLLTGIQVSLELITDNGTDSMDPGIRGSIEQARSSSEQLLRMVNELLDIQRLEEGHMPVNQVACRLDGLVDEAMTSLGGLVLGREIAKEFTADLEVSADRKLMRRILTNLVANALRFTPLDGIVTIYGEARTRHIIIGVRDTGPGIPAAQRETIFEKFGQVDPATDDKRSTSGLGLTFCRLAVEAHGGTIGVENHEGGGADVRVTLPLLYASTEIGADSKNPVDSKRL